MNDTIKVKVTKYGDRKNWMMYYDCPLSGKRVTRSTGKTAKRQAERVAAVWEDELKTGRYKPNSNVTWEEFRERYETEVLPGLADNTYNTVGSVFNAIERICTPKKLSNLTAERLSHFQKVLRSGESRPRSEATIRTYLAHLKAALKWAVEMGMLTGVPTIKMPKRAKGQKVMKGRPITREEFERMLDKVPAALFERKGHKGKLKPQAAKLTEQQKAMITASWRHFLTGLWWSGLRLGEALELYWERDDKLTMDLAGPRPMFLIRAALEKGNEDRILPMTPDFAQFVTATHEDRRRGPVFRLLGLRRQECRDRDWVSHVVCRIGKLAGVKVNTSAAGKVKFASAHDLRRSFGARWAPRVMPVVLQQLMRHESIDTTLRYYVGQDAVSMADTIWAAAESTDSDVVNTFVNSEAFSAGGQEMQKPQVLENSRLS